METINKDINQILLTTSNAINTNEWENLSLNVCALNKIISLKAFYEEKENFVSFDPEQNGDDVTMQVKKLREDMYSLAPQKGAWYSAMFTLDRSGVFNSHFDYENKPEFKYEPSKDKFIDDIQRFPREKELIPSWLADMKIL